MNQMWEQVGLVCSSGGKEFTEMLYPNGTVTKCHHALRDRCRI